MLLLDEWENPGFGDMLEQAKEKIKDIYPAWTNFNPADSGMALLELFVYMTQLQQFHVEQIGQAHLAAFLHMLNMTPKGRHPAKVYARAEGLKKPAALVKGTKAFAGDMTFELTETVYLEPDDILCMEDNTNFYPFGENPSKVEKFEIPLRYSLKEKEIHTLYFDLYDDYPVKRNKIIPEEFLPLVRLHLEYYDGREYQSCEIIEDTTFGLLKTGRLQFRFSGEMGLQNQVYKLKLTAAGEYDTVPIIKEMFFNMLPFLQKDTVIESRMAEIFIDGRDFYEIMVDSRNCVYGENVVYVKTEQGYQRTDQYAVYVQHEKRYFVFANEVWGVTPGKVTFCMVSRAPGIPEETYCYEADGMPNQRFFLPDGNILGKDFAIWVEEPADSHCYKPWVRIPDLAQAGPGQRCYVLLEKDGILQFGDGKQGKMPKGKVKIVSYTLCAGKAGNIHAGQMSSLSGAAPAVTLYNPHAAYDGYDEESVEDCIDRYRKNSTVKNRAVTYEDYEEIIKNTPGLRIKKAKVFPSARFENALEIVVQPYTDHNRMFRGDAYNKNIIRRLEKKRMLGTRLVMKKPEYVRVFVRLEVIVESRYLDGAARIEESIKKYFEEQMDFGKSIVYSRLYGYIDSLPEVSSIEELTVYAEGREVVKDRNDDIMLPVYGMAYPEEIKIRCVQKDNV